MCIITRPALLAALQHAERAIFPRRLQHSLMTVVTLDLTGLFCNTTCAAVTAASAAADPTECVWQAPDAMLTHSCVHASMQPSAYWAQQGYYTQRGVQLPVIYTRSHLQLAATGGNHCAQHLKQQRIAAAQPHELAGALGLQGV